MPPFSKVLNKIENHGKRRKNRKNKSKELSRNTNTEDRNDDTQLSQPQSQSSSRPSSRLSNVGQPLNSSSSIHLPPPQKSKSRTGSPASRLENETNPPSTAVYNPLAQVPASPEPGPLVGLWDRLMGRPVHTSRSAESKFSPRKSRSHSKVSTSEKAETGDRSRSGRRIFQRSSSPSPNPGPKPRFNRSPFFSNINRETGLPKSIRTGIYSSSATAIDDHIAQTRARRSSNTEPTPRGDTTVTFLDGTKEIDEPVSPLSPVDWLDAEGPDDSEMYPSMMRPFPRLVSPDHIGLGVYDEKQALQDEDLSSTRELHESGDLSTKKVSTNSRALGVTKSQFFRKKDDSIKRKDKGLGLHSRNVARLSGGNHFVDLTSLSTNGNHVSSSDLVDPMDLDLDLDRRPTDEELKTLRKIPDNVPIQVYTIGFIEVVERVSYSGTVAIFTNFIQQPNPGTPTGRAPNPHAPEAQPGALGLGQRPASAIVNFNVFFVYLTPMLGAYLADTWWGRLKVVRVAVWLALIGHIILVSSALPNVLTKPSVALGLFFMGLVIMGVGTGCFKPNIAPLIAEQTASKARVKTLPTGERVIVDPTLTTSKVYHWFYMLINIGSLIGQVTMVYTERYFGYWLAFLIPTICFIAAIPTLELSKGMYKTKKPQGNVLTKALQVVARGVRDRWHWNPIKTYRHINDGTFWTALKPSSILPSERPVWYTFNDAWIDELQRGFAACGIFLWYPLYWLSFGQLSSNLTSQAATLYLHGIPNDVISNIATVCTIILVPALHSWVYPALRNAGYNFSPIKKITAGFLLCSLSTLVAGIIQVEIYRRSPCGHQAAKCKSPVPISVWVQAPSYILLSLSEAFTIVTAIELAFHRAPQNMRSFVSAFGLLMVAVGAILGEATVEFMQDPLLVWGYFSFATLLCLLGICFWVTFRNQDGRSKEMSQLPEGRIDVRRDIEV